MKDLETEMILDHPRRMSCIVMRKQRALRHRQQGRGFCVKREAETGGSHHKPRNICGHKKLEKITTRVSSRV